ncbi:MAG: response regulator transcription factor [Acidobacteriota bacterium]|nr:response regulator transcription factor [Acidobacteriota bacterium]MDH3523966.1 response regulator transcription factor [Acidobacteriota bacterium]
MIEILIVDDHELVREGIRAILEKIPDFRVVGEAGDGRQAVDLVGSLRPDVVLMDISLPGGIGGLEAAQAVIADHPDVRVIMLTQYGNREYVRRAVRLGAHGYLLKSGVSSQLIEAVRTVARGERYLHPAVTQELFEMVTTESSRETSDYELLTPREKQVFKLLAEGMTSRQIAEYLTISIKTAMTHRSNVMAKLGFHSRAELIKHAVREGVIRLEEDPARDPP